MSDRFFSVMVIPERSDRVRKFTVPALYFKLGSFLLLGLLILSAFIFFDYLHVLSQVAENKRLRSENFQLKHEVEEAKSRVELLDQTVSRIKVLGHKLKVLGNLDSPGAGRILERPVGASLGGSQPMHDEDSGQIGDDTDDDKSGASKKKIKSLNLVAKTGPIDAIPEPNADGDYLPNELNFEKQIGELGQRFEQGDLIGSARQISEVSALLSESAEIEEQKLSDLQDLLTERADRLRSTPSVLPAQGWISSEYGYRIHPITKHRALHAGIDLVSSYGTPIYAPADGVVTASGFNGNFGQVVRIDHGYGIVTKFGHLSRIHSKKGERIKRGDKLGEMGSTGRSTGTHVHYQVEVNGRPVNPRLFILEDLF